MYFNNFTSIFLIILFLFFNNINVFPASDKEDAPSNPPNSTLEGQITANGEPVPRATVQVKSTTIGTAANKEGEFDIEVPAGEQTIVIRALGYKPEEKQLKIEGGEKNKMSFDIEEDVLGLEQVVVTASRDDEKRKESSVIVNTLNNPMLEAIQAANLSEGLSFSPGLRIENNCGNCGANSLRMNGLDGPYTQILINGRPIFSGLAAVYGLEFIPANMIERVEVVRGGGSALYGSNAIAGTVNVLTREPNKNQYSVSARTSHIGSFYDQADPGTESQVNFNTTLSDEENKNGVALYGSIRDRKPFDANDDGFSELSEISNTTVGGQWSIRPGHKSKIVTDFFHIREERRGGDQFDAPLHEAQIAEATEHSINSGNLSWRYFPGSDQELTTYAAAQDIQRDSYYGAGQALDAYGHTKDLSYSGGLQYKILTGRGDIIAGLEINGGNLLDKKLGYREFSIDQNTMEIQEEEVPARTIADQETMVSGGFAQIEQRFFGELSLSGGLRLDHYNISDNVTGSELSNNVLSPRLTMLYGLSGPLQFRASYAQGYRAPQIFDEDLHIETSDSRQVIHKNDPDLKQETSHSYTGSLSYIINRPSTNLEILAEFFRTKLNDPFANEIGTPDESGKVVYTRVNEEEGATVQGVNLEANWVASSTFNLNTGFTIQKSEYGAPREFGETRFFRTPDNYGYFNINWKPLNHWEISTDATYTGEMLVPYFGPRAANPEEGILKESDPFLDWSVKINRCIKTNRGDFDIYLGTKNILNSYQSDFDSGKDRDPGYIFGPISPRTIYAGVKVSNIF